MSNFSAETPTVHKVLMWMVTMTVCIYVNESTPYVWLGTDFTLEKYILIIGLAYPTIEIFYHYAWINPTLLILKMTQWKNEATFSK